MALYLLQTGESKKHEETKEAKEEGVYMSTPSEAQRRQRCPIHKSHQHGASRGHCDDWGEMSKLRDVSSESRQAS